MAEQRTGHEHTRRCYWDFREAQWVCRPAAAPDASAATEFPPVVVATEQPVTTVEVT
ncbi:MAG: hypothetical protein ACJ786_08820 [Catenulispora sp.]|jgi:hypothetical protein